VGNEDECDSHVDSGKAISGYLPLAPLFLDAIVAIVLWEVASLA
jgi:hypothetical protein